jgi:hypothetical protein
VPVAAAWSINSMWRVSLQESSISVCLRQRGWWAKARREASVRPRRGPGAPPVMHESAPRACSRRAA